MKFNISYQISKKFEQISFYNFDINELDFETEFFSD